MLNSYSNTPEQYFPSPTTFVPVNPMMTPVQGPYGPTHFFVPPGTPPLYSPFVPPGTPPLYSPEVYNFANYNLTPAFSPFMNGMGVSPQIMTQMPVNFYTNEHTVQGENYNLRNHMSELDLTFDEHPQERSLNCDNSLPNPNTLKLTKLNKTSVTLLDVMNEAQDAPIPVMPIHKSHSSAQFVSAALDRQQSLILQHKIAIAKAKKDFRQLESMYHEFFPEILRLSRDPFANFLMQRLIENLRMDLVDSIAEKVKKDSVAMATHQCACRVLQSILTNCSPKWRYKLVNAILPEATALLRNNNGCYVLQKIIEIVPSNKLRNLLNEHIIPNYSDLCMHQYGCRVVQDIFRYFHSVDKIEITNCVLQNIIALCKNGYSNYVVQKMINYADKETREKVYKALLPHVVHLCCNKSGSNILEKFLSKASDTQKFALMRPIIENEQNLKTVVRDKFGNYVLQRTLVSLPHKECQILINALKNYFSNCDSKNLNNYEKYVYQQIIKI